MPRKAFPAEIDEMVENISDVPEPNAVFLNSLREQFISMGIANAQKNTETKMIKISRRGFLSPRRTWAIGIVLLIVTLSLLATSPTVVNALKHMFGFIPGVGFVDQTSSLRVLAMPFSTEKDGVLVNITQVVVDNEKTIIIYEYPAIEVDYNTFQPPSTFKEDHPILLLPDGTRLTMRVGRRISSSIPNTIGYSLEFPPLPSDVNDATLELTRLAGLPPGAGPEDWSIPLHVIPAPAGTVLPLVTINETEPATPTMTEAGTSSPQTPPRVDTTYGIQSTLESFVRMDDGYLLIGSAQWDAQSYPAYAVDPMIDYATVTDAAGKPIDFEVIYGIEKPQNEEFRSYWAIKITDTNFRPPLEISITSMVANFSAGSFQFDPGENPQPGQSFPLSVDVLVAGKNVHFSAAQLNRSEFDNNLEFLFTAQTEPIFLGDLYISMPIHQCMGGGGSYPAEPSTELQIYSLLCRPDLPPGLLDVQINGADLFGAWVVTWQP